MLSLGKSVSMKQVYLNEGFNSIIGPYETNLYILLPTIFGRRKNHLCDPDYMSICFLYGSVMLIKPCCVKLS